MSGRTRRLTIVAPVLAGLVAAAAIVAYVVWPRGSELERAAVRLPEQTLRVAWTDWAGVRDELDAGDLDTEDAAAAFLLAAADRDLSATSALEGDGVILAEQLGFSPQSSDWELLGQSRDGMLLVMDVGDDTDLGDVAGRFESFEWQRPADDALEGGIWQGGADVLTNIPGFGNPVLANVAFLEEDQLLLASDSDTYLEEAIPVARGDEDGLDLGDLAADVEDPLSAMAFLDDFACEELSMDSADPAAQAEAEAALDDAGGVSRLNGYLAALEGDGALTVVLAFEDEDQAERNEDARRALAGGLDPGQMVSYSELFEVEGSRVEDDRVVLELAAEDGSYPLSNITAGPVLLASC